MSKIEYVYATLLLHSAGKDISEESIKKVLEAAGIAVDDVRVKSVVSAVKQVNIDEILKTALAMPAAAPAAAPAAQQQKAEEKKEEAEEEKEEEKKEVSEEELEQGLSALFG